MIARLAFTLVLAALGVFGLTAGLRAGELLMFEDPSCSWCRRWHAEIGPSYPRSPEGRLAPLRRLHIRDQAIAGVLLASPIRVTPTFVLAENGREIGRIVGYPGPHFFYPRVEELLKQLPPPQPEPRVPSGRSAANAQGICTL